MLKVMRVKAVWIRVAIAVAAIAAIAIGVAAVGGFLKRQNARAMTAAGALALESAELQLERAAAVLPDLAARDLDACRPATIEAMRQAALRAASIKSMALIGRSGEVLCSDVGVAGLAHEVLASVRAEKAGLVLDVVRWPGQGERMIRIRRATAQEPSRARAEPAALVPASLLLPQVAVRAGPSSMTIRLALSDGTVAAESGGGPDDAARGDRLAATLQSERYPFALHVSASGQGALRGEGGVYWIGAMLVAGAIVLALLLALFPLKRRRADPMAKVARAIRDDGLVPHYQPIVDLQSGKLIGAEVMARWRRPDGLIVDVDAAVLESDQNGLVLEMTRSLMRRALAEVGEAVGRRPGLALAFNVAPRHFDDAQILSDLGVIFDGSPVRLSQVVLELTERHEAASLSTIRRTVAAMQRIGCKVAIDNGGTGHGGLSTLLKLGVDIVKIDRIFIETIGAESRSKAVVETLIDLAKSMRMEIVAEGVTSFDQVVYLRDRGVGAAQGRVFAPPLPASTFMQLMDAMDPVSVPAAPATRPAHQAATDMPSRPARGRFRRRDRAAPMVAR